MGLLDQITEMLGGEGQAPQRTQLSGLAQAVLGMLGSGSQQQNGLQGLLQAFQRAGLDDVIRSWVSTGENKPISGAQLQQALGRDRIAALAQQAGLSTDQGLGALTQLLPSFVDRLTPDGNLPDSTQLSQLGGTLLRSLLK